MVHPLWKQYGNPQKTKNRITVWSNNSTSGYISEENENTNSKRYRHPYVHVSIIYSNQDMETTEVSINRWMKTWYTCLCVCVCMYTYMHACMLSHFSCVWLLVTLWTGAHQAPLSMRFSRQEYQSGFPCLPAGDLPDPGIEPRLLCLIHWQMGSLLVTPGNHAHTHTHTHTNTHNGILLSCKKEWNSAICNDMDELGEYYT